MRYLTVDEIILINAKVFDGNAKLRDRGLLESAVARPQASAFGEDAYPTLHKKAAALLESLTRNHAFVDGNKRTATIALVQFLEKNGYQITWIPAVALEFILDVAQGKIDLSHIEEWLIENTESVNS